LQKIQRGPAGIGGGIELDTSTNTSAFGANITDSTIFGNSAHIGGNLSDFSDGSISLFFRSTIIGGGVLIGSSPVGPDINGKGIGTGGSNIVQDVTSARYFPNFGDITGVSPFLLPLGNYGGETPSMPPQPGSPAISSGELAFPGQLDQRGAFRRPSGFKDRGAVGTDYAFSLVDGTPQTTTVGLNFQAALRVKVTDLGAQC